MYRVALLAFLAVLFVPFMAVAAEKNTVNAATQRVIEHVFSETEKAVIKEYFGQKTASHGEQCPRHGKKGKHHRDGDDDERDHHGKGKHGKGEQCARGRGKHHDGLPPGLEKQLKRNGRLPPGLEGRDLPPGLAKKLSVAPKGTKRVMIGNDVVLLDPKTQVVLDVITDVFGLPKTLGGYNN